MSTPRQAGPHAHCISLDAANRFAVVADLGLDQIRVDRFDPAASTLTPNEPPFARVAPGSGPRHVAFDPGGRYLYAINEMQSTIAAFAYDPDRGALSLFQTVSTLPEGFRGESTTAEIAVHPSGKFLYGSNRGHDTIAGFAIDPASGRLRPIAHTPTGGKTPRNFAIDPSGRFLLAANQDSGTVVVFRVDAGSGRLDPVGPQVEVPKPVCVVFVEPRD